VYAHTSGWGERPEGRRLVGTDFLVQAYAGVGQGVHPEGEPAFPSRMILCDLFGGLVAAEGVLAGLHRRELTGTACEVRSSLLAGAMAVQAHVLEAMAEGKEDGRRDGRPVWGTLDRPLHTAEGMLVVSVDDDEAFEQLCRVCDVDPAGASRAATEELAAAALARGTAAAWEEDLAGAHIPAAKVCDDLATVPSNPRLSHLFEPVSIGGVGPSTLQSRGLAPRSPWTFS
jgi:CoA:oxalate CoA-transferase